MSDFYGKQIDEAFASFPETDTRFVVNGIEGGPNSGIAGMILKPWDERERTPAADSIPLVQGKLNEITGEQVFAFSLPPLPGSTGGLPVQMVISSPAGYETVFRLMEEIKAAARKSGLFIVTDSDLAFNNPVIRVHIDRSKANDLGITMAAIGETLATMVGGNYVNRFNLNGRSYEVIPQVPRSNRLTPESLGQYYVTTRDGRAGAAVDRRDHRDRHGAERADPVQPAQLRHLLGRADAGRRPWARRSTSSSSRPRELLPADFQHAYLSELAALRDRGQPARGHLRVRADRHLPGAGGAVRIAARSVRDPGQRADVDLRRPAAAVPRPRYAEHLHPDRAGHPDRPDQQARHPDGGVRQRTAAQREPRPARGDRARSPGAAAARS